MQLSPYALPLVLILGACSVGAERDVDEDEDEYVDPGVQVGDGKMDGASSVDSVSSATCSTVPVRGLSMQIAEEIRCLAPDLLVPFEETSKIHFATSAVLPYIQPGTRDALMNAANAAGSITVNSGLRSIAQHLKTQDFMRLRVGVGRPERGDPRPLADYLLSDFAPHDDAESLVARAADAVETLETDGIERAQVAVNRR